MRLLLLPLLASLALGGSAIAAETATTHSDVSIQMTEFQAINGDSTNLLPSARSNLKITQQSEQCCKICTTGKACGNSCINRNYQCHQPPGCACDG